MHLTLQPGSRPQAAGDKFIEDLAVFREFRSLGTPGARRAPIPVVLGPILGFKVLAWSLGVCENRGPRAGLHITRALGPRAYGPGPRFEYLKTV